MSLKILEVLPPRSTVSLACYLESYSVPNGLLVLFLGKRNTVNIFFFFVYKDLALQSKSKFTKLNCEMLKNQEDNITKFQTLEL